MMRSRQSTTFSLISLSMISTLLIAACADDSATESSSEGTESQPEGDAEAEPEGDNGAEPEEDSEPESPEYALDELTTINIGAIPGTQSLILDVMDDQGISERYNLELERTDIPNPTALHVALVEGGVDMGFGGLIAMTRARAEGRGTVITNMLSGPSNLILSAEGSGVENIGDLAGGRLGIFSGCAGQFYQMTQALAAENFNFDLAEETDCTDSAGPALIELAEKGEFDGILLGTVESMQAMLERDFQVVADLAEAWEETYGGLPAHISVATRDEWLAENEDVMVAFNGALSEAVEYASENPQVWEQYAEDVEFTHEDAGTVLAERVGGRYVQRWDEAQLEAQEDLLELLIELASPDTFVDEIPDGLFRLDLQPGRWNG